MWRYQQEPIGGTDYGDTYPPQQTKKCKYSPAQEPCVLREPSKDDCHSCLKANYERENEVGIEACHHCGLEQPAKDMEIDHLNGWKFCRDRTACWERWDVQHGIKAGTKRDINA